MMVVYYTAYYRINSEPIIIKSVLKVSGLKVN